MFRAWRSFSFCFWWLIPTYSSFCAFVEFVTDSLWILSFFSIWIHEISIQQHLRHSWSKGFKTSGTAFFNICVIFRRSKRKRFLHVSDDSQTTPSETILSTPTHEPTDLLVEYLDLAYAHRQSLIDSGITHDEYISYVEFGWFVLGFNATGKTRKK